MSQSSGPSLMRHFRQHINESENFVSERGTYDDNLNGDKQNDDQFHP